MKTQMFLLAMLCALLFTSCEKSTSLIQHTEALTRDREESNMEVSITLTNSSVVNVVVPRVSATYVNATYFTVVTNPGTGNAQSYSATSLSLNEPNDKLKITKSTNGGLAVVYEDKATANISIGFGALNLSIQAGNISTTATSIIGEEADAL